MLACYPVCVFFSFFRHRHFHNSGYADASISGIDAYSRSYNVDRYTIGFEKKLSRNASLEVRLPIVSQMGSDQSFRCDPSGVSDGAGGNFLPQHDAEIGNISLAFKQVLRRTRNWTHTAGLGLNLPTASDADYQFIDGDFWGDTACTKIKIKNQECRLLPYYALQWHPNSRTFGHFLGQIDIPLNSNDVIVEVNDGVNSARQRGRLTSETLLRLNVSIGQWLYKNDRADLLNRVGVVFEAHYTVNLVAMGDRDCASVRLDQNLSPFGSISAFAPRNDNGRPKKHAHVVNLVGGLPMQFGKTTVTPAVVAPVTDARYFSTELSLLVNRRF